MRFIKHTSTLLLILALACAFAGAAVQAASAVAADSLEQGFRHPPDSARPWVNWFWVDGNVTRAGLTADLEAMQRVGIGGALLMDVSREIPAGPVAFNSPEWRDLFKHTVAEAQRLGLRISVNNADGWTGSGGPWITPALAMQQVTWSKTNLTGPAHFKGRLPGLAENLGFGRSIATLAFPTLPGEGAPVPGFAPKLTASGGAAFAGTNLLDGDRATFASLPAPKPGKPQYLQLEFAEPFTASVLNLTGTSHRQSFEGTLQVSDDGRNFRNLRDFSNSGSGIDLHFEAVSGRWFRILFTRADTPSNGLEFSELELAPLFRVNTHPGKSSSTRWTAPGTPLPALPPFGAVSLERIVDLSAETDEAGHLDWDIPEGHWTVLRLGYMPLGTENHPCRPGGLGLECDKLSREAMDRHFAAFPGQLIADCGPAASHAFAALHIDSWEVGFQNWTPRLREEFQRCRGYDPLPWLPVLTGRYVADADRSERFLWDMRRTIADLLADNYAGRLAELAHQHGLELSIEAYGLGPFDDLQYGSRADVPMAEFWTLPDAVATMDQGQMSAAAHISGKRIVAAEAFTADPQDAKWQNHPFSLKAEGDAAFCSGINRLVFHRYAHQPWLDRQPGLTMGSTGVHYERTETWWEQSRAWHEYLARCQFLLQQGLFVADLCYLTEEGAFLEPPVPHQLRPAPPPGYSFDLANAETVLTRMSVKDGRLVLPDGMSYRLLVLPPTERLTPVLLRKLKQLVADGASILGVPPTKSPGLTDFPHCDAEVQELSRALWGKCDGKSITEHLLGKGKVVWGKPLASALSDLSVSPDFQQLGLASGIPLRRIHRTIYGADIYFVANANPQPLQAECEFRVRGKWPELWHPDTGKIEKLGLWHSQDDRTVIPLSFAPAGSVFVVFREPSTGVDPAVSVTRDGRPDSSVQVTAGPGGQLELSARQAGVYELKTAVGATLKAKVQILPKPLQLSGPWDLLFPPNAGAPPRMPLDKLVSWTTHTNPGVRYFSGAATYRQTFSLPPGFLGDRRILHLDLGQVQVIAEVKLNGQDLGILWKPPFETDITQAVKQGDNALEVRVVNLWPNRLIGDEQLPDDCQWRQATVGAGSCLVEWPQWLLEGKPSPTGRIAFTTWKHWTKYSPLLESGLLGPVTVRAAEIARPK